MAARTILNYQIQKVLGSGGMGTVYLASHQKIGRKVAIKELKPEFVRDAGIRARFKNEAALMANLSHPNIVALHDYVEAQGGGIYLIMEYVEGITLDAYIQHISGPITESLAIEIFTKVLDAFTYAHERGIVHRDIKPANIMITPQGDIKILDFGIAKSTQIQNRSLTRTGMRMGTIFYMSPEQIRSQDTDLRSDIYSLGITFFEMLTAKNPYESDLSDYDISSKIINEPLPLLKSFYPNTSPEMQAIIEKATAKSSENRFQSIEEFKEALLNKNSFQNNQERENKSTKEWKIEGKKTKKQTGIYVSDSKEIKKIKEELLLDNNFGIITTRKVLYYKGRDLFEDGEKEELYLRKLIDAEFKKNKELFAGMFMIILSLMLIIFLGGWLAYILTAFIFPFSLLCFANFPTIVIIRKDLKKVKMKGWPWHNRPMSEYYHVLKELLQD